MKLIVITSETLFDGECPALNRLFDEGLETLHLRKPSATEAGVRRLLEETDRQYHDRIVLHDHFALLKSYRLKGVHLNRRNPIRPQTAAISVSRSCHSFEDLGTATDSHDYMFLSPVFDSISKSGYNRAFTGGQLLEAKAKHIINEKVIALGGVDEETIPLAAQYGFGGVAVLGAIWESYLPGKNEDALLEKFHRLHQITHKQ